MPYPIEKKLVIAVASSALFDLTESDSIFQVQGLKAYKEYQRKKNLQVDGKAGPQTWGSLLGKS